MPTPRPQANAPRRARPRLAPLQDFLHTEAAGGIVLAVATVVALVWANSPWSASYVDLWHTEIAVEVGSHVLGGSLSHWVNDLAMAFFFFVVGLEIKREIVHGELRNPRTAALPIACALGGIAVPALLYLSLNAGHPATRGGWGIPMATDIAFSIGVLSLLGRRVPASMKVFLLTLAIVDDIGAILVIAVFYSDRFEPLWLAAAVLTVVGVLAIQRAGVRSIAPYVVLAAVTWLATYESGVHATIAGVVLGLVTPARAPRGPAELQTVLREQLDGEALADDREDEADETAYLEVVTVATEGVSPLGRLEHALHPWTAFVVLPVFALANAGVSLSGGLDLSSSLTLGIVGGLVLGKPIGIALAAVLAIRFGGASLPSHAGWLELVGVGCLAGIGFTVSLFVSGLAFEGELVDHAKIAVLAASMVAGLLGAVLLLMRPTSHPLTGPAPDPAS
ncbi:MAG: Na+/H+ antiporter NhaA [Actinobacteria bacterium]|nr:Na+/H+ antiporter NhaA [Actinomycetota bacterium]